MNGEQPKVEIFEPFGVAFEMMKKILFQPFDLGKWCVIGFAAFLAGSWGHSFNFNLPSQHWNTSTQWQKVTHWSSSDSAPWLIPLFVCLGVFILVLILVLVWISARGRFIFTDCVVKNRAAIALPWREYRREGNSYFLFSLVVGILAMLFLGGVFLVLVLPLGLFKSASGHREFSGLLVLGLICAAFLWIVVAVSFGLITHFMVPIMYRRRRRAADAFMEVTRLMMARPASFILYLLFGIVLVMAFVLVSTIVTCLTCCVAGLPYISSVVFLPIFVWLLAFKFVFLRQFGPEYDVWAVAEAPVAEGLPTPPEAPPPEVS